MRQRTRIKLKQLALIIGVWLVLGFLIAVYDHLVLYSAHSLGPTPDYTFLLGVARNMGGGLIGGLLGGSLLVFFVNEKYQDKPYAHTILFVSISFLLIIALIAVLMALLIIPARTGEPLSSPASREAFIGFLTDSMPLKAALVWSIIVAVTQLLLQVNKKFGYDTFWNIIRGKYNRPRAEERIFMFLDINASTSIAERLGNSNYHRLLKDFFADITNPVLNNGGHIYQYAGDEVIISWKYQAGITASQCLKCFFDIKAHMQQLQEKYMHRYGLLPSFKAGLHSGLVIAGEVGIIKRDITYSGDVLNTAARIRNMCSKFNVELIVSQYLLSKISTNNRFSIRELGAIKLRGKEHPVMLCAVIPAAAI